MTGRLIASLLWLPVVLVAPLRSGFISLSEILWPSAKLDDRLLRTPVRLLFLGVVLALGYALTAWAADRAVRWLRSGGGENLELLRPHGGDTLTPIAIVVTIVWLLLAGLLGALSIPLVVAALLVAVGIAGDRERPVIPSPAPMPAPRPPAPIPEPPADEDFNEDSEDEHSFRRVFKWLFNEEPFRKSGREHAFRASLTIPRDFYEGFRKRSHKVEANGDYVGFVDAELDDDVVNAVASRVRALTDTNHLDRLAEIHLAMAFTLSIAYASDQVDYGGEYPKFPVETLVDKRGDCEDHAILCGAVLHRLGHRVGLVLMETEGSGHAALAVESPEPIEGVAFPVPAFGCDMFYCEVTPSKQTTETTTGVQWWLGMKPPQDAHNFSVHPIGEAS